MTPQQEIDALNNYAAKLEAVNATLRKNLEEAESISVLTWRKRAEAAESRLAALQAGPVEKEIAEALNLAENIAYARERLGPIANHLELPAEAANRDEVAMVTIARAYRAAQARIADLKESANAHRDAQIAAEARIAELTEDRDRWHSEQIIFSTARNSIEKKCHAQAAEIKDYREALDYCRIILEEVKRWRDSPKNDGFPFDTRLSLEDALKKIGRHPAPSSDPGSAKI